MRTGLSLEDLGDLLEPRTVIRLVPDRLRAWDFNDDLPMP